MYANQILKTILYKRVTSVFDRIDGREDIVFSTQSQIDFFHFLQVYYRKYDTIPSRKYCKEYFSLEKDNPAKEVYKEIIKVNVKVLEDLEATIDLQLRSKLKSVTQDLVRTFITDMKLGNPSELKSQVQQLQEDLIYVSSNLDERKTVEGLLHSKANAKEKYLAKYNKRNTGEGYYIAKTGIEHIDKTIGGIHSVDFISIVGYTKQYKSTLARQIAYNITTQGRNVMFITLEMSYDDIENHFYTLHANNQERFGYDSPKITNRAVKEATLTSSELKYFEQVVADYTGEDGTLGAEDLGSVYIKQPEGIYTLDMLKSDVKKVNRNIFPVDVLVIDGVLLMYPNLKSRKSREEMNIFIADIRSFGLTFEQGRGLPIIAPFQVNRKGYDLMLSNKSNLYDLTAIGDYNEIERSSTHIFSTAQTKDMRDAGEIQIQHLASRESEQFEPRKITVDGSTGVFIETKGTYTEEDVAEVIEELEL